MATRRYVPGLSRQTQSCSNLDYDFIFNSWDTLSASIADKIRSGSIRQDRRESGCVEFAAIDEKEELSNEKSPLINRINANGAAVKSESPTPTNGISWYSVAFGLANASIGVGILNYPFIYDRVGGIQLATFIQIALIFVLMLSMTVIIYCSDLNNSCSYHEVLSSVCGPKANIIVGADIAVATYGVCIAYLVIIGDQYDRIFASLIGNDFCKSWYLDRRFTIAITGFAIYPICLLKRLDFLRHTGPLGIFSMLYVVFLTVYQHYSLSSHDAANLGPSMNESIINEHPVVTKTSPDNYLQVLAAIPVICFGYQCNEVIVPIYASLRHRSLKNFLKAAVLAWSVLILLYCTVGSFGYTTFGTSVAPNVMTMFDAKDPLVLIGVCALIFKMVVTYPQMAFAGREAYTGLMTQLTSKDHGMSVEGQSFKITTIWFFSSLVISSFAPHIGIVLELLGTLAAFNVFVCPAVCLLFLTKRKDLGHSTTVKTAFVVVALVLITLGTLFFSLVLYQVYVDIEAAISQGSKSLCVI